MINIASTYGNYDKLLEEFGEQVIQERIASLLDEYAKFVERMKARDKVAIDERLVAHAVLDYFSDISRLKAFHGIDRVNDIKVFSYEAYWLLKRKPLQIIERNLPDDTLAFVNEKFIMSMVSSYLLSDNVAIPIVKDGLIVYKNFLNTFYYALKYRNLDAQSIELLILAFRAGQKINT